MNNNNIDDDNNNNNNKNLISANKRQMSCHDITCEIISYAHQSKCPTWTNKIIQKHRQSIYYVHETVSNEAMYGSFV